MKKHKLTLIIFLIFIIGFALLYGSIIYAILSDNNWILLIYIISFIIMYSYRLGEIVMLVVKNNKIQNNENNN